MVRLRHCETMQGWPAGSPLLFSDRELPRPHCRRAKAIAKWLPTEIVRIRIGLAHLNLSLRAQRGNLVALAGTQPRNSYQDFLD